MVREKQAVGSPSIHQQFASAYQRVSALARARRRGEHITIPMNDSVGIVNAFMSSRQSAWLIVGNSSNIGINGEPRAILIIRPLFRSRLLTDILAARIGASITLEGIIPRNGRSSGSLASPSGTRVATLPASGSKDRSVSQLI
jgi:hypothetical protein